MVLLRDGDRKRPEAVAAHVEEPRSLPALALTVHSVRRLHLRGGAAVVRGEQRLARSTVVGRPSTRVAPPSPNGEPLLKVVVLGTPGSRAASTGVMAAR